jgi:hypothetical protein
MIEDGFISPVTNMSVVRFKFFADLVVIKLYIMALNADNLTRVSTESDLMDIIRAGKLLRIDIDGASSILNDKSFSLNNSSIGMSLTIPDSGAVESRINEKSDVPKHLA